jgi:hypothetical protein
VVLAQREIPRCARNDKRKPYRSSRNRSRLCFSGFFRLSGTTRVVAGTSPAFRARLLASTPLCSFFFLARLISVLLCCDLLHCAVTLVNGLVCIREGARVGIRDVNVTEWLSPDFVRSLSWRPERIK